MRTTATSSSILFLSTPSARRATHVHITDVDFLDGFLSTPSARRATFNHAVQHFIGDISIHALREEGDNGRKPPRRQSVQFLSTPSARRATCTCSCVSIGDTLFLSTPSTRRATSSACICGWYVSISIHALREEGDDRQASDDRCRGHFYPRPPRGGRQRMISDIEDMMQISIHALREEGAPPSSGPSTLRTLFLSTPSARRATVWE